MPRKAKTNYFTQEHEDAILRFKNDNLDEREKNRIFETKIYPAFKRIAESLIHRYKAYYNNDIDYLAHDVICHLFSKIKNFNPEFGKAYSYFTVLAKCFIWTANNASYKYIVENKDVSIIEQTDENSSASKDDEMVSKRTITYNELEEDCYNKILLYRFSEFLLQNKSMYIQKECDERILLALVQLLKTYNMVDTHHKKVLYIILRELSGEKTENITKFINSILDDYYSFKERFYNNIIK